MTDVLELLRQGTASDLAALREREVIRGVSATQMCGDYAEFLVCAALGGELPCQNNPGWDVLAGGKRVSVKSRNLGVRYYRHFQQREAAIRDFDVLVLVEFSPDWTISLARQMTWDEVPTIRDYHFHHPGGRTYHRFYRNGKWRTAAATLDLAVIQERTRQLA